MTDDGGQLAQGAAQEEKKGRLSEALSLYIEAATRFALDARQAEKSTRAKVKENYKLVLDRAERVKAKAAVEGGKIGGITYPLWLEPASPVSSAAPSFIDPDGLPTLSDYQVSKLDSWRRLSGPFDRKGRLTLIQDLVTNCSLVSSLTILADWQERTGQEVFQKTIYPFGPSSIGRYHLKLFLNGQWRSVTVDDRLPMTRSDTNHSIAVRGLVDGQEILWPAILEKGYMKVMGGYDFKGSTSSIDCHILAAWPPEYIDLPSVRSEFWHQMQEAWQKGECVMTLGTGSKPSEVDTLQGPVTLVPNHSYSLMQLDDQTKSVRLCNPWSPIESSEPRLFDMSWDSLSAFQHLYLNWNPVVFPISCRLNDVWPTNYRDKLAHHSRRQPQYVIEAATGTDILIVLERHFNQSLSLDTFAAIEHHRLEGPLERIMNDTSPRLSTPVDDSPIKSIKITKSGAKDVVMLSRFYEVDGTEVEEYNSYTLTLHSKTPVSVRQVPLLEYHELALGQWTAKNSGGTPNDLDYLDNPQYSIETKSSALLILTLETMPETAGCLRLYRLASRARLNVVKTMDLVASSGAHRFGSTDLRVQCPAGKYGLIVSHNTSDASGPYRLCIESQTAVTLSTCPSRSAGLYRSRVESEWNGTNAKGNPRLGEYESNPKFKLIAESSTTVDIYLALKKPGHQAQYHLAIYRAEDHGLGEQVGTLPSYSDTPQGVLLEGVHLPPSRAGYYIVPSTYSPYLGPFILTVYSDRKCRLIENPT